jgi:hypothetical protein
MSNEFTRRHFINILYTLPRITDASNIGMLSNDLMLAFLWRCSNTINTVSCAAHIDYGIVGKKELSNRIFYEYGFRLKHFDVVLADVFADWGELSIPDELQEQLPNLTYAEWKHALSFIACMLRSFHTTGRHQHEGVHTQGMGVQARALTYKLYAASQCYDTQNGQLLNNDIFSEYPDEATGVEYGKLTRSWNSDEKTTSAGLKIPNKNIFLSDLLEPYTAIPAPLLAKYPVLSNQAMADDLPHGFLINYETTDSVVDLSGYSFPGMWWMMVYFVKVILRAFEQSLIDDTPNANLTDGETQAVSQPDNLNKGQ